MSDTFDHGFEAYERAWNGEGDEPAGDYDYDYGPRKVFCRYCGKTDVYWSQKYGKWCLMDCGSNKPHTCIQFYMKRFGARKRK